MGNVGKPPHLPAGKARTSEEWRTVQDNKKIDEFSQIRGTDPTHALTAEEKQPILHGGQRPGVESRISDRIEENEDLKVAESNLHRNKTSALSRDEINE